MKNGVCEDLGAAERIPCSKTRITSEWPIVKTKSRDTL